MIKENETVSIGWCDNGMVDGKFMQGVVWARDYDQMLKISDVKKRERKEQDERNRQLVNILKNEKNSLVIT